MDNLTETLPFAALTDIDRRRINGKLTGARNTTMLALIGNPRGTYTSDCEEPTNPHILAMIETADLGPFRVRGLRPAVEVLTRIMADIHAERPDIHASLGSAGMLCCRLVRGSATAISNHSWGTAIDLTVNGQLHPRGDARTQRALFDIHPIFNRHEFFWGAAFGTADAMHFEASDELVRDWARAGVLGAGLPGAGGTTAPRGLTTGDRGPQVAALQQALNAALAPLAIATDGIFGKDTRAAVVEFQRRNGLQATGIAGDRVLRALGLT